MMVSAPKSRARKEVKRGGMEKREVKRGEVKGSMEKFEVRRGPLTAGQGEFRHSRRKIKIIPRTP